MCLGQLFIEDLAESMKCLRCCNAGEVRLTNETVRHEDGSDLGEGQCGCRGWLGESGCGRSGSEGGCSVVEDDVAEIAASRRGMDSMAGERVEGPEMVESGESFERLPV